MNTEIKKKPFYLTKFFKVTIFFALIFIIAEVTGTRDKLSPSYVQGLFSENFFLSISVYALLFIIGNFLHVPGGVFLIGIVLALDKFYGGMITYFVATLSCMITYWVIGFFTRGTLDNVNNKIINKFIGEINSHPIRTVFTLRLLLQSAPVLNYTLASTKVPLKPYFIGTILGLPLPIIGYCFFFEYLIQVYS